MPHVLKTTFLLKRATKETWETINPILELGEPGFEYDTNKLKIGDGRHYWTNLPYLITEDLFVSQEQLEIELNKL
jgi:hypothetical protein